MFTFLMTKSYFYSDLCPIIILPDLLKNIGQNNLLGLIIMPGAAEFLCFENSADID